MKSFSFILRYQCFDPALGNHPEMPGILSREYTRIAPTARQAVLHALAELREIIPQGYLAGVGPDLLDFPAVAQLFELNQKNMRDLMAKYGPLFPAPLFIDGQAAWHCADILGLLVAQGLRDIPESELEMAQCARAMNQAILQHAD